MVRFSLRNPGLLLACLVIVTGCRLPEGDPLADVMALAQPQWSAHVQPFLAARCGACHSGERPAAGLDVTDWDRLITGSDFGEALIAFDPEFSLMVELGHRLPNALPPGYEWRHEMSFDAFREHHTLNPIEVAFLRRWIANGARNDAGEAPFDDATGRVFVAVQDAGMVSVIDVDRHVVARNVHFTDHGGRAATPHDTAYEPDGSAFYVTLIGARRVVKVEPNTGAVIGDLNVAAINPTYRPGMLALDPDSDRLYLSRSITDLTGGRSIVAIDRTTMQGEEVLVPYTRPHPIGLTRDGRYILSGSLADNIAAAIDTETWDVVHSIRVDGTQTPLLHYDVAPDGRTAAITGQFSNRLYILDITDPQNLSVIHAVPVGHEPWYPAYSADGRHVIVPNHRSNDISVVDVAAGTMVRTITHERFAMPHGAAASHDGRYIFVSNSNLRHDDDHGNGAHQHDHHHPPAYQPRFPLDRSGDGRADNLMTGHVAVIDARTYEVIRIIEVEEFPSGMSLWQE
jgi:DNA-binding beta-propeller fold protein YncE